MNITTMYMPKCSRFKDFSFAQYICGSTHSLYKYTTSLNLHVQITLVNLTETTFKSSNVPVLKHTFVTYLNQASF